MLKEIHSISQGILRGGSARRTFMTCTVLGAAAMVFIGMTFLATWLVERPVAFIIFWGGCAWLTLLSVLLALYDMLALRREANVHRKAMARQVLEEQLERVRLEEREARGDKEGEDG